MPTVAPPPPTNSSPPVSPPSAPGAVTPVEAGIGSAPDRIQQLAHQVQVSGLITQPPDGGAITINTVIGNLTILLPLLAKDQQDQLLQQLNTLFQSQRPLTVVIQPGNPPTQAFLLLPPASAAANAAQANVQPGIPLSATTLTALEPGVVLPAVVLPANTAVALNAVQQNPAANPFVNPATNPPAILQTLPNDFPPSLSIPGEELPAVLLDASLPQQPAAPAASPPEAPVLSLPSLPLQPPPVSPDLSPVMDEMPLPQAIPAAAASLTPSAPPVLSSLFQPGAEVSLRVDAVALPPAPPPVASLPNQIVATVTGSGPNGQLLVQAGDTTLYVRQSTNAPVGSTLLVTVEPGRPPPLTPLPLPDAGNFDTLQQALAVLAQADPLLARQVMENVIPQPNDALGGTLLFFLSALGQSGPRGWLGNNAVDLLTRTGKMELIARLSQQLSEGGQMVHDPVVGAWRSYTVPLHANNQFQTLHLYVHGDGKGRGGKDGDKKPGANAIRFLIDMRLSKLGALQLDGFVRPKQLDMIVRSEHTLPEGLNQDLRQSYIKSLEAIGYAGSLNFQIGRQHWLALRKPAGAGSVVM